MPRKLHSLIMADLVAIDFFVRHPGYVFENPRDGKETRRAMREYVLDNPVCQYDGKSKIVSVHHVLPVSLFPQYASSKWNLLTLQRKRNHIVIGHGGNYKQYVLNAWQICGAVQIIQRKGLKHGGVTVTESGAGEDRRIEAITLDGLPSTGDELDIVRALQARDRG